MEIIAATGQEVPPHRVVDASEMPSRLVAKVIEETYEAMEAIETGDLIKTLDELADIQTAADALASTQSLTPEQVRAHQKKRDETRGTFSKRIVMEFPDNT